MNINRHNYEEYFLLYVDNELTDAERSAVEEFVAQNPDLEEELVMMMQSVLKPDTRTVFPHKELLFRNTEEAINEINCESWFVLYGDNELTNEEKARVEQFVYSHPQFQAEFELIQQARLAPDHSLVYPHKNALYRTEEDDKVVPFAWWRVAAAAAVVLFLAVAGWLIATEKPMGSTTDPALAGNESSVPQSVAGNNNTGAPSQVTNDIPVVAANQGAPAGENKAVTSSKTETTANGQPHEVIQNSVKKPTDRGNIEQALFVSSHKEVTEATREMPEPSTKKLQARTIDTDLLNTLADAGQVTINAEVKPVELPIQPNTVVFIEDYIDNNEALNVANASLNKNSLRGLFRKVSRVFDKNGDDPDAENRKGIQIANFELVLK